MGIIDGLIQKENPKHHVIIEAHPDIYAQMDRLGWLKKANVTVVFGRWQDVIDDLDYKFDGIYFDTYGEYYEDMQALHKRLPSLMNMNGVYSYVLESPSGDRPDSLTCFTLVRFFNGLSPDNIFFHLVAGEVARRELNELGFSVAYHPIDVNTVDSKTWSEVERIGSGLKYWHFDQYFAPKCTFTPGKR